MPKFRVALLIVLAGTLAFIGYFRYRQYTETRQELLKRSVENMAMLSRYREQRANTFLDDASSAIPGSYPRPPSDWFVNEQHFYESLLAGNHYEVLVAPLQVDGAGFDRATRLLMTAELTTEIAKSTEGKIPDPYLINKIFGEGRRSIDINEIHRITKLLGVQRVVWGAVGHDRHNTMHVRMLSQVLPTARADPGDPTASIVVRSVDKIPFGPEQSPIQAFEERLPDIVQSLGANPSVPPVAPQTAALDVLNLPIKPAALLTGNPNAARDAYLFSLFYQLTPAHIESSRELFAAKAYMATRQLSSAAPEYRVLRGRALMMLGYRRAAMKALGSPGNDEERELSAVFNGDLLEARSQAHKASNPLKRLIEQLDVVRTESDFDILTSEDAVESVKALDLPGRIWPYLVARAATDGDPWAQFDNATLKALLDTEFSVPGYDLPELLRGQLTVGNSEKLQSTVDLSVFNHVSTYLKTSAKQWCCDFSAAGPQAVDYLQVLSAIGHDNLIRRVNFLATVQRSPARALQYADSLQSIYKGDPYYALARSAAELNAAEDSGGAEQQGLLKAAYEDAFNAMFWEQAQSAISSDALNRVATIARHEYGYFDNFYATDIPFHPLYRIWGGGGDPATIHLNGQAALDNATSQFEAVHQLAAADNANEKRISESSVEALEKQLQGRFIGCPERNILLANQRLLVGDDRSAASLLRDNIKLAPFYRESYFNLGKLDFELGRPDEAASVFLSYPGLNGKSVKSPVEAANVAGDMGNYFYSSGDFSLAIPLYRIAASQGSGTAAEMASAARMKVLEGDVDGAFADSLERAQRYHDSYAYRDLFSIMHAKKSSEQAWSGFNTLVGQRHDFALWQSALVGHHMGGSSEAQVTQWAEQAALQRAGNRISYATSYLVMFATTDRIPSQSLAAVITDIDRPTWQFEDGALSVVRPDAEDPEQHILGPPGVINSYGVLPIGAFNDPMKHRVRPALSYFVDGYRAVKRHDFFGARKIFDEASGLYDMAATQSSYMLPYFALASAKAGSDVSDVTAILSRFSPNERGFDYQLTSAVLEGIRGKAGESLASLRLARYRGPKSDDNRPTLPQYTYGDICEILYGFTKNEKFRDEALDWARSRERAEPWYSWSYAIDAALARDPNARDRALAMLFYLDPGSSHLLTFNKAEIDEATRKFSDTNVFKGRKPGEPKSTTT
jgi:hypothetical protein